MLENVDFTVDKRQMIYIVGPNGGGKTTLLKLVMGLIQPEKGRVLVFGNPPDKVRSSLGYAPQHMQFDPHFPVTVTDIVLMGRLGTGIGGRYSKKDREAAMGALHTLEVDDLAKRSFSELSGGQRQRVLIARSLCDDPDLLLGASPRATLFLMRAARTRAAIEGREYVIPDDVKGLLRPVLIHRMILRPEAQMRGATIDEIVDGVAAGVPVPGTRVGT